MFTLGNFAIDEILYGVAQNADDEILYTLDQLSNASIEISAESTDITDKLGNVIYTRYTAKTGTFTATNALMNANIMSAGSGSDVQKASLSAPIVMPVVKSVVAGADIDLSDAIEGTVNIIGIYGNGANGVALTKAEVDEVIASKKAPEGGEDLPIEYVVRYEKEYSEGIKLVNSAKDFPTLVKLTLYASYIDPCDEEPKPCYIVIKRFMADPSMTISLDRENQEIDLTGNLNVDYCSGEKELYAIYFPEEVATASV